MRLYTEAMAMKRMQSQPENYTNLEYTFFQALYRQGVPHIYTSIPENTILPVCKKVRKMTTKTFLAFCPLFTPTKSIRLTRQHYSPRTVFSETSAVFLNDRPTDQHALR